MKKLSILIILFSLLSCSKVEESYVKLNVLTKDQSNILSIIKYSHNVSVEVSINDSTKAFFDVSTISNDAYTMKTIKSEKRPNHFIYTTSFVDSKLSGSHTIQNNVINGRYYSKTSNTFIEFKNYQL